MSGNTHSLAPAPPLRGRSVHAGFEGGPLSSSGGAPPPHAALDRMGVAERLPSRPEASAPRLRGPGLFTGERGIGWRAWPKALKRFMNGSANALKRRRAGGPSRHVRGIHAAASARSPDARPPQRAGLEFFNVHGPDECHKGPMRSVVARRYADAASDKPVALFRSHRADCPDGGQSRDFVHVDDCVSVILWLLDNPRVNGV